MGWLPVGLAEPRPMACAGADFPAPSPAFQLERLSVTSGRHTPTDSDEVSPAGSGAGHAKQSILGRR